MKKTLLLCLIGLSGLALSQTYYPVSTTGYNLDAIAEDTSAVSTTGGAIDGSDHVMYSAAYGLLYPSGTTGLPNNGFLSASTRSYQLQPYTQNNTLLVPQGLNGTISLATPATFIKLSLLCFATGADIFMNVTVTFTDNTIQSYYALSILDWYTGGPNTVATNFDRATRTTGAPDYAVGNPNMYYVDLDLTCTNRIKKVKSVTVANPSARAEVCVMALAGSNTVSYSVSSSPVTCAGGNNGSATVTVTDGAPPFTYDWGLTPPVNTGTVNSVDLLPVGATSYTVTDASNCIYVSTLTVGQATVGQPPLVISSTKNPICYKDTIVLSTSGAATYAWSNGDSTSSATVVPGLQNNIYNVVGTTSANCTLNGSYTVTVNPLPVITFTSIPARVCLNASPLPLSATPPGGIFAGNGITFGSLYPNLVGPGIDTLSYSYVDTNGCAAVDTIYTTISTPTVVVAFTVNPSGICEHSPGFSLTATPAGGIFSGQGVSGGVFTPSVAGLGTDTIAYRYTDANNCSDSTTSVISVTACAADTATGIQRYSITSCQLYPNPNNGSFTIKTSVDLVITLVNQLGQSLKTVVLDQFNSHEVFVEDLPPGVYFLKAQNQVLRQKIIVAPH